MPAPLAVAVTKMKQKTKREEFCFSFLTWVYAAFPETYAFAPTRKPVQGSRSNASDRHSLNCLHVRNLLCLEEDLVDRICFAGMSKAWCWCFLLVHSLLCFVSGYFHLGHSFTSDEAAHPAYRWTPFSVLSLRCVMCQCVSGCVAMSVSVSTVSRSPEGDPGDC